MKYTVLFYWDRKEKQPVLEFIRSLPQKTRQKISAWIDLLEEHGPFLKRPYADKVTGKLYELRVRLSSDNVRILYFFFVGNRIVLLHAFRKKEWAIDSSDLGIAERRMNDFLVRYQSGNIRLEGL